MASSKKGILTKNKRADYASVLAEITTLLESARRVSVRALNAIITTTYWQVGRRIVEFDQKGQARAKYGEALLERLAKDLTRRLGRGFSERNLEQMRRFYLEWPISQTLSAESSQVDAPPQTPVPAPISQTLSAEFSDASARPIFPLPWSHYVKLMAVENPSARLFYETEALRGGWSVRQLDRQISTLYYERSALSKNKTAALKKGVRPRREDAMTLAEEIKDPYLLEFLDLKDEYSENDLEEALIQHLEHFLIELGGDFTFVGRQRRLRIGNEWYRVDLLFFHRRLRCLVIIDLKLGKFTHADVGQMHLYLNYARRHWMLPDENPPVGLVLCAQKDSMVAQYALDGLPTKILAAKYKMTLPRENVLAAHLRQTQKKLGKRLWPSA